LGTGDARPCGGEHPAGRRLEPDRKTAPEGRSLTFYGRSFIAGPEGAVLVQADRAQGGIVTATVDLDAVALMRCACGLFRDRRPEP